MRERDFQKYVVEVALRFGWKCWHVPAPMRASRGGGFVGAKEAAGLADLILLHDDPPRLIFAEIKGDTGWKLTAAQREFLQAVRLVGERAVDGEVGIGDRIVAAYCWQPGMEDALETVLRSKVLM